MSKLSSPLTRGNRARDVPHEPPHRFVAALVLLPAQFLKQHLRRVAHLRRPTMDLLPPLLSQHLDLPERSPLGVDRPLCRQHPAPPLNTWGGEFSMTTDEDYWVTRDSRTVAVRILDG